MRQTLTYQVMMTFNQDAKTKHKQKTILGEDDEFKKNKPKLFNIETTTQKREKRNYQA